MKIKVLLRHSVFAGFLLLSLHGFSQDNKREELEQRRLELQQEIKRINSLRTSNLKKEKSILTQVEDLDQQIRSTEKLIRVTNQQANLLTREINTNQNRIGELRKELEQLKEDYSKMIRKSYKSKSQQSRVMFLLSSENFLQAYKRLQYMKQYANYRHQQGEEIKARTEELQQLNQSLAEQKKTKDKLIAENRKTRAQLESSRKEQQVLIAEVRKKEGQFASQLRKKQQEINSIDREIERIIEEAIAASNKAEGSTSRSVFKLTPEAKALAADFEKNKGKLPWPVRTGTVVLRFGTQPHPIVKTATMNSNGVRIATDPNSKARAVFGGTVSEIIAVKGSSLMVMVRHGDYITIYNHLETVDVRKGQQVALGQDLGSIAINKTDGRTTLYFVMYKNNQKLNPEDWIYQM
ncbi:peptidoglycan DD-metalloendopeptidase family protein [Salinimicrobium tongyeongense]|jgi:septal ring factor EnvC (AmiA/AmiB activator)|uniref:Peptidoglycan DD-metalloendopeptidase family protein n=1 Tax=Salinimicrobium tongyeongense TaxID=2809707 RepID=A0ABY6NUK6_9FLAO|nr:peptidoglycan DD-metalloendopeptidase family protein [Salinimicrobium tongyeongense]UZH56595.1 peptidoglycan DD-metalloendopeptidase family protein [Salinimicrobium tongyeongense]